MRLQRWRSTWAVAEVRGGLSLEVRLAFTVDSHSRSDPLEGERQFHLACPQLSDRLGGCREKNRANLRAAECDGVQGFVQSR